MTMRTPRGLTWLLPLLLLAACAAPSPKPAASATRVTPQLRSGSSELRAYQLIDWVAPDDRTLLVNSVDRSLFKAQFRRQCTGLRLVDTIAFIVPTPPQVDKYEGVVLPDGTRCVFTSITRLETGAPKGGADAPDSPASDHL
jgi:hypothetical protein